MDISEQNEVLKEYKQLNRQARSILKQMKVTPDSELRRELYKQFNAIQQRIDKVEVLVKQILEEYEKPIITPGQAQNVWDNIRQSIRLAKFNDNGIELPAIDMSKLFRGRKSATWQEINTQIQDIINEWEPLTD